MSDWLGEILEALLRLVGVSVEGSSERTQALALFAVCTLFGLVAGCFSSGLSSTLWWSVSGICGVAFLVTLFINRA